MSDDAEDLRRAGGRPSKFDPGMCERARRLAEGGAIDHDIAEALGIGLRTLYTWKAEFPQFRHALKRGKSAADDVVEAALFRRATGYNHDAVKIITASIGQGCSEVREVPSVEHHAPDTTAAIFCLENRRPNERRDRREVELSRGIDTRPGFSALSKDKRDVLKPLLQGAEEAREGVSEDDGLSQRGVWIPSTCSIAVCRHGPTPEPAHMISDIPASAERRPRGRPSTRVELEDVPRLRLPHMLASGQAVPGSAVGTDLAWSLADGGEMRARVVAELKERHGQVLVYPSQGRCCAVEVVSDPQPFGGRRWWFICPVRRIAVSSLYLPPGAERFASRQAHGLGSGASGSAHRAARQSENRAEQREVAQFAITISSSPSSGSGFPGMESMAAMWCIASLGP